ncbi:DUF6133 family protein [Terrisporobacter petrolearius]|uniref:DUF6133 family protein n=1 Tax=Terrisporobacter petrolearius TaxID=1460447 RepID=UPI0031CCB283
MIKTLAKGQVIKGRMLSKVKGALKSNKGETYIDTGVKTLIAVVIGALLLGGLYLLFKDNILPTLSKKITEMFNFKG